MLLNNNSTYKIFNTNHTIDKMLIFKNSIKMSPINTLEDLYKTIHYTTSFLLQHNILYCIESGTLLGCARHQGIIPWDDDMDIMIFKDGYDRIKTLMDKFITEDFYIMQCSPGFKIFYKNIPYGELFVYDYKREINKYCMSYPYVNNVPTYYMQKLYFNVMFDPNDIFPIQTIMFEDFEVCVPNNIIGILKSTYKGNLLECIYNPEQGEQHKKFTIFHYKLYGKLEQVLIHNRVFLVVYYIIHSIISKKIIKF